jgi:hypothetical protein
MENTGEKEIFWLLDYANHLALITLDDLKQNATNSICVTLHKEPKTGRYCDPR